MASSRSITQWESFDLVEKRSIRGGTKGGQTKECRGISAAHHRMNVSICVLAGLQEKNRVDCSSVSIHFEF